jgi:xylan 1,4-beta-xylosidase
MTERVRKAARSRSGRDKTAASGAGSVDIRFDVTQPGVPLPHLWEFSVGSGHATLALRADYQAQLARCRVELGVRHVRFHGLLSDDMGTLLCERKKLLYQFVNADRVWDFLVSNGMRPIVELSFMPTTLASGSATVFHYRGNVTPPRDYAKWEALIRRLGAHCVERYGAEEVRQWPFEVWNEPNLRAFWQGGQREYFDLYHRAADGLRKADEGLRVGGPATASNAWIEEFLDFCETHDVPADFVSTHHYPTDAFGRPGDDTEAQLAASTRSVLRERAAVTHRRAGGRPLYYTEWNTSSNSRDPLHDEPYAAAVVVKTMLEATGLVDGYSFWTFSDIFEENYFPALPFHGGFGLLNLYGVAKPTYRAFELLHALGTDLVASHTDRHPTVDAWIVRRPWGLTVMLTNHALPRHPISDERVRLRLDGASSPSAVTVRRIDAEHANARARWQELGEPGYPSAAEVDELHEASTMRRETVHWRHEEGALRLEIVLPPHAVAAIEIDSPPLAPRGVAPAA